MAGAMAWPCPVYVCARRRRCPGCRLALRHARGPDLSGAVLLPSPRRTNPRADRPALPERGRHGCPVASSRLLAGPEEGAEEREENATPPENPSCCSDYRVDSCCGTHSARCLDCCSTRRRERPSLRHPLAQDSCGRRPLCRDMVCTCCTSIPTDCRPCRRDRNRWPESNPLPRCRQFGSPRNLRDSDPACRPRGRRYR